MPNTVLTVSFFDFNVTGCLLTECRWQCRLLTDALAATPRLGEFGLSTCTTTACISTNA